MTREQALAQRREARERMRSLAEQIASAQSEVALRTVLPDLREVASQHAGFVDPLWHLASTHEALGEYETAREYYLAAVRTDREVGGSDEHAYEVYTRLAQLYEVSGQPHEATRYYNRFLGCYPLSRDTAQVVARVELLADCGGNWLALFQSASHEQRSDRCEVALDRLRQAIVCYPTAAFLHRLHGVCLRRLKRQKEAIAAFNTACSLDEDARLLLDLGVTYGDLGDNEQEADCFAQAVALCPHDAFLQFKIGSTWYAHLANGELPATGAVRRLAEEHLRRSLELSPEGPWKEQAVNMLESLESSYEAVPSDMWVAWVNDLEGLEINYPAAASVDESPDGHDLLVLSGMIRGDGWAFRLVRLPTDDEFDAAQHLRLIDYRIRQEGTRSVLRRDTYGATSTDPRDGSDAMHVHVWEIQHRAPVDDGNREDVALVEMFGTLFRGDDIFELHMYASPDTHEEVRDIFLRILQSIQIAPVKQLYLKRKHHYERIVSEQPENFNALASLGEVLVRLDLLDEAQQLYSRLLEIDGRNPKALGDLGLFYLRQGKIEQAVQMLEVAVPESSSVPYVKALASCYEQKGHHKKAAEIYAAALRRIRSADLRVRLGACFETMKRLDKAENEYQTAIRENPLNLRARLRLGDLFRNSRRINAAVSTYRDLCHMDPQFIDAQLVLAATALEAKDFDTAEEAFGNVLTTQPGHPVAADGMRKLVSRKLR